MTKRTRLYLDVDGVLNAWYANRSWPDEIKSGEAVSYGITYTIKWSPKMVERLNSLDVDLVIATTWQHAAVTQILPLLGITLDVVGVLTNESMPLFPSIDWKHQRIMEDQLRDPSPFIWIDDEITFYHQREAEGLGGIAISPEYNLGLSPVLMERADLYVASRS